MSIRKINLPKGKTAPKTSTKPVATPKVTVAAAKTVAKPKTETVAVARPRKNAVPRVVHELTVTYAGPSMGVNKRKSTTALDIATFGTKPDYVLTERTLAVARGVRAAHGKNAFTRGNIDAGVMKYLGWKGFIEHVDGDPATENATFKFSTEGLKHIHG